MKLYLDIKNRRFVKSAASNVALTTLVLKRRDQVPVEIVFVENGAAVTPPTGTTASIGLKAKFSDSNFLAFAAPGTNTLDLYTEPVEAAFLSNPASLPALLEVKWGAASTALRTATLQVELQNSVITGTEGTPTAIPDLKSTQALAEAGTDNSTWMTPLRTAQAIAALAATDWDSVSDKPATFPPSTHTHTASQITDFAAAVVAAAPPTTNASLLTSGTLADARLSATAAASLAKADTASQPGHGHAISDVSGLQTSLDSKASTTALTAEETARIAGDTALDTKITAETTARTTAVSGLQTALAGKQPIGDYLDPALAANTYQKRDILLHQELTGFFAAPLGSHSVRTRYNVAVTGNGTNAVFILPKLPEGEDSTRYFNLRWEIYVAALPDTATLTFRRYRWDTASQQYFNPNQLVDIPVGPVRVGDTFTFILGNSNDPFSTTQDGVWHMVGRTFGLRANYAPHSTTANGLPGDLTFSDPYLYVCVNTNQWRRVPLSTW